MLSFALVLVADGMGLHPSGELERISFHFHLSVVHLGKAGFCWCNWIPSLGKHELAESVQPASQLTFTLLRIVLQLCIMICESAVGAEPSPSSSPRPPCKAGESGNAPNHGGQCDMCQGKARPAFQHRQILWLWFYRFHHA